jgi:hypothetical protein
MRTLLVLLLSFAAIAANDGNELHLITVPRSRADIHA